MRYVESTHNYSVYFPSLRMKIVHMDVKFYEEKAMGCSLERYLQFHSKLNILALKEDPQEFVE